MKNKLAIAFVCTVSFVTVLSTVSSCKKDKDDEPTPTDTELLNMARETSGFMWYKNSSALLNKSSGSGHSQPLLRTRFNSIASAKLDANGKIISGSFFADGSLIVKELNDNASTLARYAILYKKAGHADADSKGWVWGYMNADGSVAEPASNKGSACNSCHSQTDNIDYMLMNKYFP